MAKTIIVSNRLPLQIALQDGNIEAYPSVGGLATGMKSVHGSGDDLWVGWSGLTEEEVLPEHQPAIDKAITQAGCVSVPLTQKDMDGYYYGFSNRTLWPLFHYFTQFTEFEQGYWESYKEVNRKFASAVLEHVEEGDVVWVHDYQLLLLPQYIREEMPHITIGFFLHIPFPSYEIFRTFPWREELLQGMLGSDLIGFHTYDYERHFLSSVKRILHLEVKFNEVFHHDRIIRIDSFPMGIDYAKFEKAAKENDAQPSADWSELKKRIKAHQEAQEDARLILSIDRMDYTKGIPNRIRAFEHFLEKYPQYREKVRMVMLAVPSRSDVPQYQQLKRETDELVGRVNGQYATVSWTPIWYFYRSLPFPELIDLYTSAQIALITPIRDGMNLVAKEYIATRVHKNGVLIMSEMAGASKELNDALLINPNNLDQMADTLKHALEMPQTEQQDRIGRMQQRLRRYTVEKWAEEFMKSLKETRNNGKAIAARKVTKDIQDEMLNAFQKAQRKLFLLDYDGTLTGFKNNPQDATPDSALRKLLHQLQEQESHEVVVISGRDKETLGDWFSDTPFQLVTDHGVWRRNREGEWHTLERVRTDWMDKIRPILQSFADRTPGSFVEEKKYSLAWHYRKTDPELGQNREMELHTVLTSLIANDELHVLSGNKVLEIKSARINKGIAASRLLAEDSYDFICTIGDDWTDEYMFEEMPDFAHTIKVGFKKTKARYYLPSNKEVRPLLELFI